MSKRKQPTPLPATLAAPQSELVEAPSQRQSVFTFADAERVTAEYADKPLPVFPDGPGAAARKAILDMSGWTCNEPWRNA